METDPNDPLVMLTRVLKTCCKAPADAQLAVLTLAWIAVAGQARRASLFRPEGFPDAIAHQLAILDHMMAPSVRDDTPDLDQERLHHEGDTAASARLLAERARAAWAAIRTSHNP